MDILYKIKSVDSMLIFYFVSLFFLKCNFKKIWLNFFLKIKNKVLIWMYLILIIILGKKGRNVILYWLYCIVFVFCISKE